MYRIQKNITVNEEQKKFIKENHGKMCNRDIAKMLGLGYTKVHRNMLLMGMVKQKPTTAKIVTMKGYFDVDDYAKKATY